MLRRPNIGPGNNVDERNRGFHPATRLLGWWKPGGWLWGPPSLKSPATSWCSGSGTQSSLLFPVLPRSASVLFRRNKFSLVSSSRMGSRAGLSWILLGQSPTSFQHLQISKRQSPTQSNSQYNYFINIIPNLEKSKQNLRRTKTKGSALFGPHVGKPRWGAASLVGTWQNRSYGLVWQDVSGWGRKDIYLVS